MKKGTPTGLLTGQSDVKNDAALGRAKWICRPSCAPRKSRCEMVFYRRRIAVVRTANSQSLRYLEQVKF